MQTTRVESASHEPESIVPDHKHRAMNVKHHDSLPQDFSTLKVSTPPSSPPLQRRGLVAPKRCAYASAFGTGFYATFIGGIDDADLVFKEPLNCDHIAVSVATHVLRRYEADVGFTYVPMPDLVLEAFYPDPRLSVVASVLDEETVKKGKACWDELVRELVSGWELADPSAFEGVESDGGASKLDLSAFLQMQSQGGYESTSTCPSARPSHLSSDECDLTDSEGSGESDPAPCTPNGNGIFQEIAVHEPSPSTSTRELSPSKSLSASATSFTPTPTSKPSPSPKRRPSRTFDFSSQSASASASTSTSPSPALDFAGVHSPLLSPVISMHEFTFPAINTNYQYTPMPHNLRKDEHGFYIEVPPHELEQEREKEREQRDKANKPVASAKTSTKTSSGLLPPFLSETPRKASKTRVMVDQLRSATSATQESWETRGRDVGTVSGEGDAGGVEKHDRAAYPDATPRARDLPSHRQEKSVDAKSDIRAPETLAKNSRVSAAGPSNATPHGHSPSQHTRFPSSVSSTYPASSAQTPFPPSLYTSNGASAPFPSTVSPASSAPYFSSPCYPMTPRSIAGFFPTYQDMYYYGPHAQVSAADQAGYGMNMPMPMGGPQGAPSAYGRWVPVYQTRYPTEKGMATGSGSKRA